MKIKINGKEIVPLGYKFLSDNKLLMREFNLIVWGSEKCGLGDEVTFRDYGDNLLIKGTIESITADGRNNLVLLGRNKVKDLHEKRAKKSIQFERGLSFKEMLSAIEETSGYSVVGDGAMPKESVFIMREGERISTFIANVANSVGFDLYSTPDDEIVIEPMMQTNQVLLSRDKNINASYLNKREGDVFSKIKVKGGSMFTANNDTLNRNEAMAGEGDKLCVITFSYPLSIAECNDIANRFIYQKKEEIGDMWLS